jgi:hypothetical protein
VIVETRGRWWKEGRIEGRRGIEEEEKVGERGRRGGQKRESVFI